MRRGRQQALAIVLVLCGLGCARAFAEPTLGGEVLPLFKARCVKCHGPAKQEAKLDLSSAAGLARGGEDGAVLAPGDLDKSLLWQRVDADEMPPDDPLAAEEKALLRHWIAAGAAGLNEAAGGGPSSEHWAFKHLVAVPLPEVRSAAQARTPIDHFLLARLDAERLSFNPEADRHTLLRRVSFDLTGLPPTPEEIARFVSDSEPDAYERMVERYLSSPRYGQRWGKYWLDAAGYADSNGYFNADTDRPLAYRYRDYVVRAINEDKPFDRFVLEQLAGDELSGYVPGQPATPEIISLLEATHFLRNSQDGTGESDGNPDEVRADRYHVLEGATQNIASNLLGLTVQCARCHDHKFEPVTQRDYYQLQAVFYSVFNIQDWVKPNDRFVHASLPGELERWEAHVRQIDAEVEALRAEFAQWSRDNRLPSVVLFHDEFADGEPLAANWSHTAPGDDAPAGTPPVELDSDHAPSARTRGGALEIRESGAPGDRWLSTKQAFDWTPDEKGDWIQVTFDLVDDKVEPEGKPAERVAYLVALADFDHGGPARHGDVLIDGNPAGGAAVHAGYPGPASKLLGELGNGKYAPGHGYGVRITNAGDGKFRLEHLVDWSPDGKKLTVSADDLADGGFGFEYCCGRSFKVDNVRIERSLAGAAADEQTKKLAEAIGARHKQFVEAIRDRQGRRGQRPGKIAAAIDRSAAPPEVHLLERGNLAAPRQRVQPAPLAALAEDANPLMVEPPAAGGRSTQWRLAWARWLTRPGSRAAALLARVQANRVWQHHFGTGIVATSENLGTSGSPPSHPELLDHLAAEFVRSGWSTKALHRLIVNSAAYRQSSDPAPQAHQIDPDDRFLWRYPMLRLDAESIRDAMLAMGDSLDSSLGGPYVPTKRTDSGEIAVDPAAPGALRRSLYLQQRRTQILSMLNVFDSPSLVFNCVRRTSSTMPLQSLCLLNSPFVVAQAQRLAERVAREAGPASEARIGRAFLLSLGREPTHHERQWAGEFLSEQVQHYASAAEAEQKAWADFCQMLLASDAFLYVE